MTVATPTQISDTVLIGLKEAIRAGATQEQVFAAMRKAGLHPVEAIKAFRMLYGGTLMDAKVAVHGSNIWADRRASDDEFHEAVIVAVSVPGCNEAGDEGAPSQRHSVFQSSR